MQRTGIQSPLSNCRCTERIEPTIPPFEPFSSYWEVGNSPGVST
uniref:Uncharacterized protein LOC103444004 isoform X2 n=1 Tax=Rhizophora mucronata TaxID=61149 RepID=A0A2P2MVV7_RHIMU